MFQYRSILVHFCVPVSVDIGTFVHVPVSADTGTISVYQYRSILVYLVAYWSVLCVPVSVDIGTFFVYQYRSLLEHFHVPLSVDTGRYFFLTSIDSIGFWVAVSVDSGTFYVPVLPFYTIRITDLTNTVWMMSSKTRSHLVHAYEFRVGVMNSDQFVSRFIVSWY